jgi:HD-like signal output (HDOD) protein
VAFTVGVMHAIGQLVMHAAMPEAMAETAARLPCGDARRAGAERERFGYDYHRVGAELAELWRFPETFAAAVREAEAPPPANRMACVLSTGIWAVRSLGGPAVAGPGDAPPASALASLGLDGAALLQEMPPLAELTEGLAA